MDPLSIPDFIKRDPRFNVGPYIFGFNDGFNAAPVLKTTGLKALMLGADVPFVTGSHWSYLQGYASGKRARNVASTSEVAP